MSNTALGVPSMEQLRTRRKQHPPIKEEDVALRLRKRGIRPAPYYDGSKRSTINLGIEDLPAGPRPESVSRCRTDDEVKMPANRNALRLSCSNHEEGVSFLTREYLRVEDQVKRSQMNSCWKEKENKLRERKNSLISAQDEVPTGQTCMPRVPENLVPMTDISGAHKPVFREARVRVTVTDTHWKNNKELNLPLSNPSLVVTNVDLEPVPEAPKPPPRRKRDAKKRTELNLCESDTSTPPTTPGTPDYLDSPGTPSTPGTPGTPSTPNTPGTPSTPNTPGTPSTPNTPVTPNTPGTISTISSISLPCSPCSPQSPVNIFFNDRKFLYGNSPDALTPDTGRAVSSTPDTLSSPETPSRLSTRSLLAEDNILFEIRKKSQTLDNRIIQRPEEEEWEARGSIENLAQSRHRQELRRSVSEYNPSDPGGSSNKARRTTSDSANEVKNKSGTSIRDRFFRRPNKNEGTWPGLSARALHRWSSYKKSRSRARKQSAEDQPDGEGVVARVTHGGQGTPPPSPLPSTRSAESTPKKNLLQRFKKGAKNASKTPKSKTTRAADSCGVEGSGGGEDGLSRSHSHENLYHSPGSRDSPLQGRSRLLQNQDDTRRTENTLKIWIMEAKDIPSKKKYFCHLIVDLQPSHRTCSKSMTSMCFWGEYFELDLNPETTTICIELKREGDKKSHKKIGSVEIDLKPSSPGRATLEEQWYPVKVDKQDKTSPALRIRHRFQSLDILPLSQYGPIRQYLKENATPLCQLLEPVLSVKAKEDIATTLINIMQAESCAINFLVDLVYTDIQTNAENEHLLFRGNSVATKAIEAYMKLVGEQYLHDTLQDPIQALSTGAEDLEVDPLRITTIHSLPEQRNSLKEKVTAVWEKILQSSRNFPVELREVFHQLREQLSRQEKCELTDNLISSCVFLRFFCPAVLSPSLFNIATEYPDERAGRNLTLVAKTLQTLANFTHFQGKERFMEFLNEFINKEQDRCRAFLRAISSPLSPEDSILEFDGKIDLGKHLALLHLHLAGVLAEINTQGYQSEASRVMALVEDISALLGDNHNGAACVSRPASGPPITATLHHGPPQMHANNNYTREECAEGLEDAGTGAGLPASTNRSQSLPRSATPVYAHHHHPMVAQVAQVAGSPRPHYHHHQGRLAGGSDLGPSEEYVLRTAFDHASRPQISMYLSEESNNNNNPPMMDVRLNNGNNYYISEIPSPAIHQVHQVHHQPQRALLHTHQPQPQPRPHPRAPQRNLSVGSMPGQIDRRGFEGNYSDFFRCMDDVTHRINAVCKDGENNIQGSQTSISQLSNIASSGYQSFAYSQSSSPVDSLLHTDNSSLLSRENGNPGLPVGMRQVLHESPLGRARERTSEGSPTAATTPRTT